MEYYRFDSAYGKLYVYSEALGAYVFAMASNGRTETETIEAYERLQKAECQHLSL